MRMSRMAAMAAAAVFVAGCSENKSLTDVREAKSEAVSLATGSGGGSGASFTTIAEDFKCLNATGKTAAEVVNCNSYAAQEDVYLNGGPSGANLEPGTYFWVLLTPSGQNSGLEDNAANNLSTDPKANRTFTITSLGDFDYTGTHPRVGGSLVQLSPFNKTGNNGGVYTLAICELIEGVTGKCKFDNFKILGDGTVGDDDKLAAPVPSKNAAGAYTRTFAWTIAKSADKTTVSQLSGNVLVNYTVKVTQSSVTSSGWTVAGTINVLNPNDEAIVVTVGDTLALKVGTVDEYKSECTVELGTNATLPAGDQRTFDYSCTLVSDPGDLTKVNNTVTVSWLEQAFGPADERVLDAGSASFTYANVAFTATDVNRTATITDSFVGPLGTVTGALEAPLAETSFPYQFGLLVVPNTCTPYKNTATITETAQTADATVTVCGPANSGLTIGFWQNKNGQDAIRGGPATAGVCNLTGYLRGLGPIAPNTVGNAFSDLAATASCSAVGTYVTNIIKAASAAGESMNPMLRAQFLATALSVYHSSDAVKRIPGPSLGGIRIDLTKVCILSSADCSATQDVRLAFGGATAMTVSEMLTYAGQQATALRGATWYANVKSTQELAKNAFDVINNKKAFVAP